MNSKPGQGKNFTPAVREKSPLIRETHELENPNKTCKKKKNGACSAKLGVPIQRSGHPEPQWTPPPSTPQAPNGPNCGRSEGTALTFRVWRSCRLWRFPGDRATPGLRVQFPVTRGRGVGRRVDSNRETHSHMFAIDEATAFGAKATSGAK